MRISYIQEKLEKGIYMLATGKGDVRKRLLDAYISFHTLETRDFPLELQDDWIWINTQLTKYGPLYRVNGSIRQGSVKHTLCKIRNNTGSKIAIKIYNLAYKIKNMDNIENKNMKKI